MKSASLSGLTILVVFLALSQLGQAQQTPINSTEPIGNSRTSRQRKPSLPRSYWILSVARPEARMGTAISPFLTSSVPSESSTRLQLTALRAERW